MIAPSSETSVLGKTVSELQQNVVIGDTDISGTLHYVADYTGFSSNPTDQQGNYLALKFEVDSPDTDVYVNLAGGTVGWVKLDEDLLHVLKIANKDSQTVQVYYQIGEKKSETKTYSLTGLTLEPSA